MRTLPEPPALRHAAAALAMAPVALYVYFFFEWLFLATGATTLAIQPMGTKLRALVEAPLPMLGGLLLVQLVASLVSLAHRSLRAVAVGPSAAILGLLALMLVDNFTYTIFGYGIIRTGPIARVPYAIALLLLIVLAAVWLRSIAAVIAAWPGRIIAAMAVAALLAGAAPSAARLSGFDRSARIEPSRPPTSARSEVRLPNILLLGSDGMDAPNLSAYGYERPTTPFLSELRRESLFFENAFSNVDATLGSMVTLLTGRLPTATKVGFAPASLRQEDAYKHLPRILKAHGYSTLQIGLRHQADAEDANLLGAFDAANYRWESLLSTEDAIGDDGDRLRVTVLERVESRIMHCFGFRDMDNAYEFTIGRGDDPDLRDAERVETLLRYLDGAPEPWFVHVHMVDTHCCKPKAERIFFRTGEETDIRDNALRSADERFRTIVEALRRNGRLERTIVVISSDHPYWRGTTGRVPLLIRFPGRRPVGTVAENVQLADVAPTILDYLDLPEPPWMDGISLLAGRPPADRPIFAIANHDPQRQLTALWTPADAGPPNYGATVGSMILGDRWYEVQLENGRRTTGRVPGHTRAGATTVADEDAYVLLLNHFAAANFEVADGRTGRSWMRPESAGSANGR